MSEFVDKILREGIESPQKNILPKQFIHSLDEWIGNLHGYDHIVAYKIEKYSSVLNKSFKVAPLELYRAVIWEGYNFDESIRSWSDEASAKRFADRGLAGQEAYVPSVNKELLVILKIKTEQNRVIVNLNTLGDSDLFERSFEYWKSKGEINFMELDDLTYEKEIIYKQPTITEKDIYLVFHNYNWISFEEYKSYF